MGAQIRILILEDNESDAELMKREMRKAGFDFKAKCAQDRKSFLQAFNHFLPDIILADYSLPGFDGLTALHLARERNKEIPVIIVSGAIGEEFAIETLKAGATDYVLKQRLTRLGAVVHRALEEARQLNERRQAEQAVLRAKREWERTFDAVPDLIAILDEGHRILRINRAMAQRLGMAPDQCIGKVCYRMVHGLDHPPDSCPHALTLADRREHMAEVHEKCLGGEFLVSTTPLADDQGRQIGSVHVARDISERKRAEEVLRKAHDELEMRVRERTEELGKSQQRLQHLASQLLRAQEKERKRVAIELHDGLLSELAATKYLLEGKIMLLEKGKLSDPGELKRVVDILANAIREARRIMNNMHPSVLDELGLTAAISWLCGEYQTSYPYIKVQKQIAVSEEDISDGLRVVIFRVLQEALNNFARHGKGDLVVLSLSNRGNRIHLRIHDNGQGFDIEKVQKGLGLESMRERAEFSGGTFSIESAEGKGATIQASWPLPENR